MTLTTSLWFASKVPIHKTTILCQNWGWTFRLEYVRRQASVFKQCPEAGNDSADPTFLPSEESGASRHDFDTGDSTCTDHAQKTKSRKWRPRTKPENDLMRAQTKDQCCMCCPRTKKIQVNWLHESASCILRQRQRKLRWGDRRRGKEDQFPWRDFFQNLLWPENLPNHQGGWGK